MRRALRRLALGLALAHAPAVHAEPAASPPVPADDEGHHTVVTEVRAPSRPVTSEARSGDIARAGAQTAADVLEGMPAAGVSSGARGERIFTLRGFDQRQTRVEVDGVPFEIPYDGQADLGALPAHLLDRVSVFAGPTSLAEGPGALGGVVRLTTRWPGVGPLAAVEVEGAADGATRFSVSHDGASGALGWRLQGGQQKREAFPLAAGFTPTARQPGGDRVNSDRRVASLAGDLAWTPSGSHRVRAAVRYLDAERGVPPSTVDPVPRYWRFAVWRGLTASLTHAADYGDDLELSERVYVQRFDNRLDAYDDLTFSSQETARAFRSWYHDVAVGGQLRGTWRGRLGPLGAAALRGWLAARHDDHEHPVEGQPRTHASRTLLSGALEAEVGPAEGLRLALGAQGEVELPGVGLAPGMDAIGGGGPHLLLRYAPHDALSLGATVARRTRVPTLKDRLSSGLGTRLANPGLRPESAWHLGLDASWRPTAGLRVDLSLFDAEVADLIDVVQVDRGVDQLQNIASARIVGAELAARVAVARRLAVTAGWVALDARRTSGDERRLAYRPRHRATLAVVGAPWRGGEASLGLRVVGSQDYRDPNTLAWRSLGAYAALDLRVALRVHRVVVLWARATNVLDSAFQTQIGYPEPGRQVWLGLSLSARPPDAR